ncbi:4736_t:CDS:2 [Diversispora eburnea]|uniref:4736_t:CDS:1 n=1 Tax=Diversispora eburnea TaxID=1213867 RepID=A0A9N8UZA6_9GLOM|nr:4736_t:CDS:2 [Diversispora eburnea]
MCKHVFAFDHVILANKPSCDPLVYDDIRELEKLRRQHQKYVLHCVIPSSNESVVNKSSYYDGCDCKDNCISEDCGCKAKHVQHGIRIPLQIFKTTNGRGWGVRTLRNICKGEFICEYAGEIIKSVEAQRRWRELNLKDKGNAQNYILCLREHNIDPTRVGNIGRYINHSCSPNLLIYIVRFNSLIPIAALFAKCDIETGKEITFDYSGGENQIGGFIEGKNGEFRFENKKCLCGSENCRGVLPFDSTLQDTI